MKKILSLILCAAFLTGICPPVFAEGTVSLPSSFDLRNVDTDGDGIGDRCYVTPVRQQGPFGTCWGFAAIGAAEISILGSLLEHDPDAWQTLNLSEKQLVWFSHVPLDDPDSPQNGEGHVATDLRNARSVYNTGGTGFLATSTFAQGIGPSDEDSEGTGTFFRYCGKEQNAIRRFVRDHWQAFSYSDEDDWSIPEEYRFRKDYRLRESILLPTPAAEDEDGDYVYDPEATEQIKLQLLQKQGVSIGFCADSSEPDQDLQEEGLYLNTKTWAHYTWDESSSNHEVVLIGWDDSYPKENFVTGHQPPADGAWLVKNSWGSGECAFPDTGTGTWGLPVTQTDEAGNPVTVGSGYFWLSYYDRSLMNPEAFVFDYALAPEYTDQHDFMQTARFDVERKETPVKMANVFTAQRNQLLSAISCVTVDPDSTVSYEIYLLCRNFDTPEDGLCVGSGKMTFPSGGYHRMILPDENPVYVQKGQPYAILITVTGPDGDWLVNQSAAFNLEGNPDAQVGIINEKESWLYEDGAWSDYLDLTRPEPAEDGETVSTLSYDNFPIKGYSSEVAGAMILYPSVANPDITSDEGSNQTAVTLFLKGLPDLEIGTPEIEWTLLKGSGAIAEIKPEKNGSRALLTAKGEGDIYLAVSAKDTPGFGTSIVRLSVFSHRPASASVSPSEIVWTGEMLSPEITVLSAGGNPLYEGEDYFLSYIDTEKCGIALAELRGEDDESAEVILTVPFAVLPQKAVITSLSAEGGKLQAVLQDQSESGITGYEISYRKEGAETWTVETITNSTAKWSLESPESGTVYEIRARAYVDTAGSAEKLPSGKTVLYSEYGETREITVE